MKKITTLIAAICMLTVAAHAQKYFKVVDATTMSWAGGMPQSGSGQTYSLIIVMLTNDKVTFSEIWAGKDVYGQPQTLTRRSNNEYKKGDTVYVNYTVHYYPHGSPMEQNLPKQEYKPTPIRSTGAGLIAFVMGKATRYRSIKAFRELQSQNYP